MPRPCEAARTCNARYTSPGRLHTVKLPRRHFAKCILRTAFTGLNALPKRYPFDFHEDVGALEIAAETAGLSKSEFARQALRAALDRAQAPAGSKALLMRYAGGLRTGDPHLSKRRARDLMVQDRETAAD